MIDDIIVLLSLALAMIISYNVNKDSTKAEKVFLSLAYTICFAPIIYMVITGAISYILGITNPLKLW